MFHNAKMAVDFFFMISGFGLTYKCFSTHQNSVSKLSLRNSIVYAYHRVSKIYPLFLLTSLLMMPKILISDIGSGTSMIVAIIKCVPKFAFVSSLTQSLTGMTRYSHLFNGVGWFMSTIFILYIIYPLLERANLRYIKNRPYCAFVIVFVTGFVCRCLMNSIEDITVFDDLEYGSPYSRLFDFLLGIILCDIYYEKKDVQRPYGTREELFISCVTLVWWLFRNCIFNGEYELLKGIIDRAIVIGVIYIFAMSNGKVSEFLSSHKMVLLGSVSMYIFLIHYCVRYHAELIFEQIIDNQIMLNVLIIIAILSLTTIWVCILGKLKKRKCE